MKLPSIHINRLRTSMLLLKNSIGYLPINTSPATYAWQNAVRHTIMSFPIHRSQGKGRAGENGRSLVNQFYFAAFFHKSH